MDCSQEKMFWEDIKLTKYNFNFELQKCVYLCDLLKDQYEFVLEGCRVVIHQNGVSEKINTNQLIYFLQYEIPLMMKKRYKGDYKAVNGAGRYQDYSRHVQQLYTCFGTVQKVRDIMDHMKIYLKYHKKCEKFICYYCKGSCGKFYECCKLGCCDECRGEGPHPLNKCPFCCD